MSEWKSEKCGDISVNERIIRAFTKDFCRVYHIRLNDGRFEHICPNRHIGFSCFKKTVLPTGGTFEEHFEPIIRNIIAAEDRECVRAALDFKNIKKLLKERTEIAGTFHAAEGDELHICQYRIIRLDGSDSEPSEAVLAFKNIDAIAAKEEKQRESLAEALNAAEQASQAKTNFLFNMSHDIRTPMNAIIGYANLMKKSGELTEAQTKYLKNILTSGEHLLSLINNVLESARIESGRVMLDETVENSMENGKNFVSIFRPELERKHINMIHSVNMNFPYVYMDRTKTEQIFLNIINNAVKYTPNGGEIKISVRELPHEDPEFIFHECVVEDNGIGISKEYLPHVFDAFSREKTETENKIIGTGLGLGIVKRLVELMNGTITIESEQGRGTKVTVVLPRRIAAEPNKTEIYTEIKKDDFMGRRILLAEDNDLNAEIAIEILSGAGFATERAEDGIVCINMLTKHESGYYDLILMDVQMPNMDGIKATREIRSLNDKKKASVPIVAMTANAFNEDKRRCLNAGMDGFISKPIDIAKLMETLADVIS